MQKPKYKLFAARPFVIIFICLFLGGQVAPLCSQTLTVKAETPIEVGENFRLQYTANTLDGGTLQMPPLQGLQILSSPKLSVNSKTKTAVYTVILRAANTGTYNIPPATLQVGNRTISSPAAKVQVINKQPETSDDKIAADDIFIKAETNKSTVMRGEPILLTYRMYIRMGITIDSNYDMDLPDFTNIHAQEIENAPRQDYELTHLNGKDYKIIRSRQFLLYPQIAGQLSVPSTTFKLGVIHRQTDDLDTRLDGKALRVSQKVVKSNSLAFTASELPQPAPKSFTGAVGDMQVSAALTGGGADSRDKIKVGTPLSYTITIKGQGNLKLINAPKLNAPKSIELYDAKTNEELTTTAAGMGGTRTFEYPLVPQQAGKLTIPAIEFTHYNTAQHKYITTTLPAQTIDCIGDNSGSNATLPTTPQGDEVPSSQLYYILIAAVIIIAILCLVYLRIKNSRKHNYAAEAIAQLRNATNEQTITILWQYLAKRLAVPPSKLNKQYVKALCANKGVSEQAVNTYISTLEMLEQARFSNSGSAHHASTDIEKTIKELDNELAKK